jgi:hypothetical protein
MQSGVLGPQALSEILSHACAGPEQEEAELAAGAERGQRRDQVRSGDRLGERAALAARRPNDAAAVGEAKVSSFEDAREFPVVARKHHKLGIDSRHLVAAAPVDKGFDLGQRALHVDAIHAHAEHPRLPRYGRSAVVVMAATSTQGSTWPRLLTKSPSASPP